MWLPIEQAPKDGTIIDVWHRDYGRVTDVHWDKYFFNMWRKGGAVFSNATHFMYIPDPPEQNIDFEPSEN